MKAKEEKKLLGGYCKCGCGKITFISKKYIVGHNNRLPGWEKNFIVQLCKCGCGENANIGKKFISGHNWKDKKHTKKSIRKMSGKNNAMKRPEVKAKHLEAVRSKEYREKLSKIMKGKVKTKEHIKNVGIALKKYRKNLSPERKEELRKKVAMLYQKNQERKCLR